MTTARFLGDQLRAANKHTCLRLMNQMTPQLPGDPAAAPMAGFGDLRGFDIRFIPVILR